MFDCWPYNENSKSRTVLLPCLTLPCLLFPPGVSSSRPDVYYYMNTPMSIQVDSSSTRHSPRRESAQSAAAAAAIYVLLSALPFVLYCVASASLKIAPRVVARVCALRLRLPLARKAKGERRKDKC